MSLTAPKINHLLGAALLCASAATATAQSRLNAPEDARVHVGPLGVSPSITLSDVGVDSNVFNEAEDPKQDFTMTLTPAAATALRAGVSRIYASGSLGMVYFQKYATQRSVNHAASLRVEVPRNRVTPWFDGGYSRSRQRVGYEIDSRTERIERAASAGLDVRAGGKSRVGLDAGFHEYLYEAGALFLGSDLRAALNHRTESVLLKYRYERTVLTTAVVEAELLHDRFEFEPIRNSDSMRVSAGFDLDERALISGTARVGYRRFTSRSGALANYSGAVVGITTGVTLKGRTRLQFEGNRDVAYSYDQVYPYYVVTGGRLIATPRLTRAWDVQARIGGQRLGYRALTTTSGLPERLDRYVTMGVGVGYHLGDETRLGFNVDRHQRTSQAQQHDYEGYRMGATVTYGR